MFSASIRYLSSTRAKDSTAGWATLQGIQQMGLRCPSPYMCGPERSRSWDSTQARRERRSVRERCRSNNSPASKLSYRYRALKGVRVSKSANSLGTSTPERASSSRRDPSSWVFRNGTPKSDSECFEQLLGCLLAMEPDYFIAHSFGSDHFVQQHLIVGRLTQQQI